MRLKLFIMVCRTKVVCVRSVFVVFLLCREQKFYEFVRDCTSFSLCFAQTKRKRSTKKKRNQLGHQNPSGSLWLVEPFKPLACMHRRGISAAKLLELDLELLNFRSKFLWSCAPKFVH